MGSQLRGRTALITGAGRGIGADAAQRLARSGANVAIVDVDAEAARQAAARLGRTGLAVTADVTDQDALDEAVAATTARFGGIDIVVANAAIAPARTLTRGAVAHVDRTLAVNLLGVVRTISTALPHVRERRGYVLAVASLAAAIHLPLMGAYAASKAGVEAYADALRLEVAASGVDVGVAYFGFVDTRLLRDGLSSTGAGRLAARTQLLFRSTIPVGVAGEAVHDAVLGRRRRVVRPRWLWPLLVAPGVFQPVLEAYATRRGVPELLAETDERGPGPSASSGTGPP